MKIRFKSSVIFLLFALTLAFSITTFGQGTKGLVEGTVSDQNGAPIAGAIVTIENKITSPGFKKSITANEKGYFIFSEVPPGMYKIQATSKNFRDFSYDVEVLVDKSITINPMLEVGLIDDMFSTAEKVNTDFGIQTNLTKKINDELPARTTFSSLLKIAPNVRPEVLAGGFQIDGASGSENVFFIDGQEVTNYRTGQLNLNNDLPFELLQEVTIKSGVIPAEYGGALGGVVTVVTPGGNNQWRGTFGISFAPEKLQGKPNLTINRFGSNAGQIEYFQPTKDGGAGYFPTASLSGPIVKDKLWFFSSYSPQIYNTTRTIDYFTSTNPATRTIRETIKYESNVRTEAAFLRFDSQPTSKLRMFGTFLYNPTIQDGVLPANTEGLGGAPQSVSGLRGAEYLSTRGGRQNSNAVNGQVSWDVTKNVLLNFRGGRSFLNEKLDSYGLLRTTRFLCSAAGSPETVPGSNCSRGFQNVSNNSIRDYDVSSRTTFDAESVISGINALGRHNFKFGYQFNRLFNSIKEGYFDTGIVNLFYGRSIDTTFGIPVLPTVGNLGSGFLQRFGTVGETSNVNHALYAQDSWTIKNRLSLNLGIRFENENLPDYRKDLNLKFGWKDKIAPRFGFAFDAFGNGKTKMFGGYGWFYDRLKYDVFQSQFPQLFYRDYFEILPSRGAAYTNYTLPRILGNNVDNPNGQCPIIGSSGWSVCQFSFSFVGLTNPVIVDTLPPVATDLKPMRSSEFSVGLEQNLGNNLILSGLFIHRQLDRTVEDVSLINSQGTTVSTIGNPGFGRICEIASGANLPCPKAERKYDAAEIRLDKRADSYFFNASYTYSRLFGNYSGLASSDELGRISPNGARYFNSPTAGFDANGDPDNGRLATDRPHVFKAFSGYSFDWNTNVNRTSISAFTTIQSGTPLTTNYSLYNTPLILFGRGDLGRTETFSETDLRISHHYKFGQDNKFSIEPYIVILNLFDERNELSRQTSISTTNFTSTALTQNGCTTCVSEAPVYQTILNGTGISQFVRNFLNSAGVSSTGIRNDYNQPNLFQLQRNVRFGMRFSF